LDSGAACNPNAINKLNNETDRNFFIVECRDARLARNVQSANNE